MKALATVITALSGFKTYLTSIIGLIVSMLVGFKVLTPEVAGDAAKSIAEFVSTVLALMIALQSLLAMFQRAAISKAQKATQ